MSRSIRRAMIDRDHQQLSLVRQCILLDVSRASVYYRPVPTGAEDLELMALMDRQYLKTPFYGSRKMKAWLLQQGYLVSRKRVRRLMRLMGLEAIYRRPNTSKPAPGHRIFPYLLKGVEVNRVDQVWAADITYIPMAKGFLYLVAIMDWHSRHVLAWKLSNTMDTSFCVAALEEALGKGRPEIFNTDQGSQFTSEAFTQTLQEQRVQVSMDGKGRYLDNIFVERLWRSIKYEEVYLKAYQTVAEARTGINAYLEFYNRQRPHQALGYRTPAEVYQHGQEERGAAAEEAGVHGVGELPGQHVPAVPVHDGHQVQEALRHGDVGDVRGPDLVDPINLHSLQQIGKDPVSRRWFAGVGTPVDRFQTHQPHQPSNPFSAHQIALLQQPGLHLPGAVEGGLQILTVHQGHQLQVFCPGRYRPVVHRGPADVQQDTLTHQRQLLVVSVYHGSPYAATHRPDLSDKKSRSTFSWPMCR